MKQDLAEETKLRRYLLAELTLEEQVLVEQQLFLDSAYSELAKAVEDDLIDDYVHDDLAASEREKFESHFLNQPEHRDDLRIAEALKKYLASDNAVDASFTTYTTHEYQPRNFSRLSFIRRPAASFALAATVLAIISVVTWIAIRSVRRQHSEQPLQAQEPRPAQTVDRQPSPGIPVNGNSERGVETAERASGAARPKGKLTSDRATPQATMPTTVSAGAELVSQLNSSSSSSSLAFTIYPGAISRSGTQNNRVSFSSKIESVILKLPVRAIPDYASYSATLRSRSRTIRNWVDLPTEVDNELGKIVKIDVATALLSKQSYEIELAGIPADSRPAETYSFWVDKK